MPTNTNIHKIYKTECTSYIHNDLRVLVGSYGCCCKVGRCPCAFVEQGYAFSLYSTRGRVGSASTYSFKLNGGDGDVFC